MMTPIKKSTINDLVYAQIKRMLINHALQPGQKINKKELAHELGVSQTPVQYSIVRLVQEGLFEDRKTEGVFVRVFTIKDMKDLFALRAGIEGIALRLCIEKNVPHLEEIYHAFDSFTLPITSNDEISRYQAADRSFHEQILSQSENSLIQNFVTDFSFILRCYHKGLLRHPNETLPEHLAIIEAARNKDAERAQTLLISHHMASYARLSATQ